MKEYSDILTMDEAVKYLKISKSTLYFLTYKRRIPCFKVGRQYRFRKSAINKWAEKQETANTKHLG